MRRIVILLSLSILCCGQTATVGITGPATATAGTTIQLPILGSSPGNAVAFQLTPVLPGSAGTPTITAGNATAAAGKSVTCTSICVAFGMNQTVIANGEWLHMSVPIPAGVSGNITFSLSGVVVVDKNGSVIPVNVNPPLSVSVSSLSKCDVNGDGQTNKTDADIVTATVNGTTSTPYDLNGDGKTTVGDVQIVVNASLGLGCAAI